MFSGTSESGFSKAVFQVQRVSDLPVLFSVSHEHPDGTSRYLFIDPVVFTLTGNMETLNFVRP
jgi:hypothetical protein